MGWLTEVNHHDFEKLAFSIIQILHQGSVLDVGTQFLTSRCTSLGGTVG